MKKLLLSLTLFSSLLVFGQGYDDPVSDVGFRREVLAALEEIIGKVDDLDGPTLKNLIKQVLHDYAYSDLNWDINIPNDIHGVCNLLQESTYNRYLCNYLHPDQWSEIQDILDGLEGAIGGIAEGNADQAASAQLFYGQLRETLATLVNAISAGVNIEVDTFPVQAQESLDLTNDYLGDLDDALFDDLVEEGQDDDSPYRAKFAVWQVNGADGKGTVWREEFSAGAQDFFHAATDYLKAIGKQLEGVSSLSGAIFNKMDNVGGGGSEYIKDDDKYRFTFHSKYIPSGDYNQNDVSRDIDINENNFYYCVAQTLKGIAQQKEDSQSIQLAILGFLKNTLDGGQDKSEQEASELQSIGDGYRKETLTEAIDSTEWTKKLEPPTILSQGAFESTLSDFSPDANIPTSLVLDFGVWGEGEGQHAVSFLIDLSPYSDLLEKCRSCTSTMLWFLLVFLAYWVFTRFIRVVWSLAMKFLDISKV